MLVHLALGPAFTTGCGVGNDSGGPHGGGGTSAISTTAANFGVVGNVSFNMVDPERRRSYVDALVSEVVVQEGT